MNATELFLIAMLIIFTAALPGVAAGAHRATGRRWWWCRSSPASCSGPGVLGAAFPEYYALRLHARR
ncbi:MAG: hypothetical protein MZW92_43210 [Comamonadaceae bacterium]|nr:hypothetical protein [Comamonadaceae bacterium]